MVFKMLIDLVVPGNDTIWLYEQQQKLICSGVHIKNKIHFQTQIAKVV